MTSLNERELEKKIIVGETWALTATCFTGDSLWLKRLWLVMAGSWPLQTGAGAGSQSNGF